MPRETVLVTGGTGTIGRAFVAHLASDARAPRVRVATRDPRSKGAALVCALGPETVTSVAFDVDEPDTLAAALDGATKLFVIAPFLPDLAPWHEKVAVATAKAGSVTFAVKSSVTGACGPTTDPPPSVVPLGHWKGEEAFRAVLPTTAIRPNIFMQHFLTVPGLYTARSDRFFLPTGAGLVSWLDARDIAVAAAALILATPGERAPYEGQAYELSGPRAHSAAELAAILSLVARREVKHVDGLDAFSARCKELGVSDAGKHFYGQAGEGWFAKVDDDILVKLTGHRARSFAEFAIDCASHFGAGAE